MKIISQKEAFDCALANMIAATNAVGNRKEKIYDFALCMRNNSLSPVICLGARSDFAWEYSPRAGEKSYAFVPYGKHSELIVSACADNGAHNARLECFKARELPAIWISDVLQTRYIRASYDAAGNPVSFCLAYDAGLLSKTYPEWIRLTIDNIILYFPFYNSIKRKKLFDNTPKEDLHALVAKHAMHGL